MTPPGIRHGEGPGPSLAVWIAGLGALLLLAAAVTFLAARWDGLAATARIAVIGTATGVAILGGHRLRTRLPVVGAVVFHLGVLLLPVDALGLALQLQAPVWVRWTAVGVTMLLTLPVAAVAGRAPILGLLALPGVPVLATGLALSAGLPAAVLVAGLAVVARLLAARAAPAALRRTAAAAPLVLAVLAVAVPVVVELLLIVQAPGLPGALVGAWYVAWPVRAAAGALAVLALSLSARDGDPWITTLAWGTGVVAVAHLLLPEATPRAVRLWAPAVAWLVLEVVATRLGSVEGSRPGARGVRVAAALAEVLALPVAFLTAAVVLEPGTGPRDRVLAVLLVLAGLAWAVGALRRLPRTSTGQVAGLPMAAGCVVSAVWHLAAAGVVASLRPAHLALGLTGLLVLGHLGTAVSRGRSGDLYLASRLAVAGGVLVAAGSLARADVVALVVAVAALAVVLPTSARLATEGSRRALLVVAPTAAVLVPGVWWLAHTGLAASRLETATATLVAGVAAVGVTFAVRRGLPPVADAARVVTVLAGLLAVVPAWPGGVPRGAAASVDLMGALGLTPAGLVPALVLGALLVVDALGDRRALPVLAAALVATRGMVALAVSAGLDLEVLGALLLTVGVASALGVVGVQRGLPGPLGWIGSLWAVVLTPLGWVLLDGAITLRSGALIAVGSAAVVVGLATARWPLAGVGSLLVTGASWSLLAQFDSEPLDLWLAPVALLLAVAGAWLRSRQPTSSWIAYVPSVLLVGVPALLERLGGGPGWHGLLAGGVGLGAVVLGGLANLRGPVVAGGAVLLAAVVVETLAMVAGLPTWIWLALGGLLLLGTAAAVERSPGSPVESLRRLGGLLHDPDR